MATAKPRKPPSGADFSALVKKVNELASKAGVSPLSATVTARIPLWKRWVGGEGPEYDALEEGGLRTVENANALFVDSLKEDVDQHGARLNIHATEIDQLKAWVAAQPRPFP